MDSVLILNTNINVTSVEEVSNLLQKREGKTIAVCNSNTLVRSYKNSELQNKINEFDIRVPDGFPVAKASSILYKNQQKRVDGYNIFHKTLEKGLENNLSHYFIGGDENFLEDSGFALQPWINVRFENASVILNEKTAIAMGNYFFTELNGNVVKVEYTFGYFLDSKQCLKINLHHSSLPYTI